ncbi:MAG TPA: glycosyltransferase family 39 protein, partial [Candidatus Baltobacteraceae bacterium]|nr:glycosyltransferase family 39 protein [Candidatus Baltobacteraceae bacterium]
MTNERSADPGRRNIPLIAAAIVFIVHLAANPHYGYFRDELYFIICGFHPQFGYVDQPPVVPLLSAGSQLFGHSLFLLRAVPAAFAAGGVYVTCLLAAEYGGGAFAQLLAALVFFFTGVLSSFGMKVSTDEVGLFTWPLLALLIVRITKGADPRLWLAAGAVAGLSIESKYSVFFFLAALLAGLLLAPQ